MGFFLDGQSLVPNLVMTKFYLSFVLKFIVKEVMPIHQAIQIYGSFFSLLLFTNEVGAKRLCHNK